MRYYLVPMTIFWVLSVCLLLAMGYQGSFLFLNSHYYLPLDYPMLFLTHVGDDITIACIFILVLIKQKPETVILMVVSLIAVGLLSLLFKEVLFSNWDRPPKIFNGKNLIHTVGTYRLYIHSFPSGHSISVAAICTVIASVSYRSKVLMLLLAILTLLICYTRVYTGVHFLGDIMVGSMVGVVVSLYSTFLFSNKIKYWFYELSIFNQKIIKWFLVCLAMISLLFALISQPGFINQSITQLTQNLTTH
jgi:membrane-associated phospholipid phosphatase